MQHRKYILARALLAGLPQGSVVAVIGAPGTGKSRIVKEASRCWDRRVVFDPLHWDDLKAHHRLGVATYPWIGHAVRPEELALAPRLLDTRPLDLVVAPAESTEEAWSRDFGMTAELVWRTGGLVLVCEEAGGYLRGCKELAFRLSSAGRHMALRLVCICQSIGRLPLDVRRHVSHVVAFAQGEPSDFDDLRARCGREFADSVSRLRVGDAPELWRLGGAVTRHPSQQEHAHP